MAISDRLLELNTAKTKIRQALEFLGLTTTKVPFVHYGGLYSGTHLKTQLFGADEQGVWYDPSDFSTMFQDAAGTIPVTAVEQPVGLMLDKSKGLVQTDVTTLSTWVGPAIGGAAFNTQNVGLVKKVGTYYILSAEVSEYSGTGTVGFVGIDFGSSPVPSRSNNGLIFAIMLASSATETRVFTRSTNTCKFTNISVRELPGNHASQTTATSRPVLSARVNLLTKTEDFSHSDWGQQNNYAYESATDPEGGNTATKITSIGATAITSRALIATSATIDYTIYVKAGTHEPTVIFRNGTTSKNLIIAGSTNGSNTYGTWTITPIANGWKKVKVSVTSGVTAGNGIIIYYGTGQVLAAGLYWYVWHPDLRPANTGINLPDYQRVNTSTDYDTAGFPCYLKFDGTDDFLVTPSIDFTGTDKMMVCAGVRKLGTSTGIVVELGNASTGAFWFGAPGNASNDDIFSVTGSILQSVRKSNSAPFTGVYSLLSEIGQKILVGRQNGAGMTVISGVDLGTGNFSNNPIYIGHRAGNSLPFNGHLYGLIVRGAATDNDKVKVVEKYLNAKTRAFK